MGNEIQAVTVVAVPKGGEGHRFFASAGIPSGLVAVPPATAGPLTAVAAAEAVRANLAAPTAQDLQQALQAIDRYLAEHRTGLEFRVDESSGRVVVSIIDAADGTVLRQIPSEEVLRIAERLQRERQGLIDAQA
jgi:flagellar protein FlaG